MSHDPQTTRILTELQDLRASLAPKAESTSSRLPHVLEKMVLPLLIAALAWLGNNAATKISEGQLELAKSSSQLQTDLAKAANEDRKQEFQRGMQAKYLEIFYKDLNSGDPKTQLNAIRLVKLADPDLAQALLSLVPSTPGVSAAVVQQATAAKQSLDSIKPLSGFKVAIFYYGDDAASAERARALRAQLQQMGFAGPFQFTSVTDDSVRQYEAPKTVEIRYEAGLEDEQAAALAAILQPLVAPSPVVRAVVKKPTPNFISVFFPRGA